MNTIIFIIVMGIAIIAILLIAGSDKKRTKAEQEKENKCFYDNFHPNEDL